MEKNLKTPADAAKAIGSSYRHYLGMIKVLEKLRRQSDLEFGPKLMNKILDARHQEMLSDEQAMELTGRVHAWCQKLEDHFTSQEYQMKKLMLAIELEDRRSGKKASNK
jgi:molybdenum-dependent DNA-binding transcriptional regulator ModE